jgi:hypothetical protein
MTELLRSNLTTGRRVAKGLAEEERTVLKFELAMGMTSWLG